MHVNAPTKMRSKGDFKIFILPTHQFQAVDSAASKESIAEPGNQKIFISKKEQRNWDEWSNVLDMEKIKNLRTQAITQWKTIYFNGELGIPNITNFVPKNLKLRHIFGVGKVLLYKKN